MASNSQGKLIKSEGSYYTPSNIVEIILDIAGYDDASILSSYVIDPAAGDGSIVTGVVKRYIKEAEKQSWTKEKIKQNIIEHVFAYEIDEKELEKCKNNVCDLACQNGIEISTEDLVHFYAGDAFELYHQNIGFFDFVIGNPPYVRIHNLDSKPDSKYIEGMCDLFYPFFDIGQQMLKEDTGSLTYITPSSWFTASAGKKMREDLEKRNNIAAICDFGHYQVFAPYATTYTVITKLTSTSTDTIAVHIPDSENGNVLNTKEVASNMCWIDGKFFPDAPTWLSEVFEATGDVYVKNGYATNLDKVFISDNPRFSDLYSIERKTIKASKCKTQYMIYPYNEQGQLINIDIIEQKYPDVYDLLIENKNNLLARTQIDKDKWWAFGRTQGIADTYKDKVAMQSLIKPGEKVRCENVSRGVGVYGGVYVLEMNSTDVEKAVNSKEFCQYVKALRKYKSGGYYALGSKDIERFLNWFQKKNIDQQE